MRQTVFKLTQKAPDFLTRGDTKWGDGVTHTVAGIGPLCTAGWLHCYDDPILAVLMKPEHVDESYNVLWLGEAEGATCSDNGLKRGVASLTTIRQLPTPVVSTNQRAAFAILAAYEVCTHAAWRTWAEGWLAGVDRSSAAASSYAAYAASSASSASYAAYAASYAASSAASAAAASSAAASSYAASSASSASYAAASYAASSAAASYAASSAAYAASYAAASYAASSAAAYAAASAALDWPNIIAWAMALGGDE